LFQALLVLFMYLPHSLRSKVSFHAHAYQGQNPLICISWSLVLRKLDRFITDPELSNNKRIHNAFFSWPQHASSCSEIQSLSREKFTSWCVIC